MGAAFDSWSDVSTFGWAEIMYEQVHNDTIQNLSSCRNITIIHNPRMFSHVCQWVFFTSIIILREGYHLIIKNNNQYITKQYTYTYKLVLLVV